MSIQILPPQLANQIAAGEVVERPASVVKELLENSLDAGAIHLDIDIERGGAKRIRVRDNGKGISGEELPLALARHATSKIATLEDLESILSLGFRGEALASISSVSRLTLTSRPESQTEAWQVYAEGRDMTPTVKPAAHPIGTTVEVLDLFYNTPARRKFLRTEKTEFGHIDEVVRRIALARCDVSIDLHHNGKLVRQYRAARTEAQRERRLAAICGTAFIQQAMRVVWQHGELSIEGWVADPMRAKQVGEVQYCYVNGRMMRDRLINHAIRQAYQHRLREEQQPAYVLYLTLDPQQVDVNVHPAKHEVRFHQARLVHDFIYQAVLTVLQQAETPMDWLQETEKAPPVSSRTVVTENRQTAGESIYETAAPLGASRNLSENRERSAYGGQTPKRPLFPTPSSSPSPKVQARQSNLYQQLMQLEEKTEPPLSVREPIPAASPSEQQESGWQDHGQGFGRLLSVIAPHFAVLEQTGRLVLFSLFKGECHLRQAQLTPAQGGLRSQPLLIPLSINLDDKAEQGARTHLDVLQELGIQLTLERKKVQVNGVPLPMRQQNLQKLIPELLIFLADLIEPEFQEVAQWLAKQLCNAQTQWTQSQAIHLLAELERLAPSLVINPPSGLLSHIDLQVAIGELQV